MKIVIPMGYLHLGGGCKVLVETANALAARGHEVELCPLRVLTQMYPVRCKLTPIPVLSREYIPYGDIVLPNFYTTFRPAYSAWPAQTVRLSLGFEPYWVPDPKEALWTYRQGVPILSISRWLDEQIRKHAGQRSTVVNPGVDLTVFHPGPKLKTFRTDKPKVIMYIARDPGAGYQLKGFHDFVASLQILKNWYPDSFVVNLVCPEKKLGVPGIPHQVYSPASDAEMAQLYREADMFVSSSWFEGYSLPPLEAMACGTPVATTNSGGVLDYCTHLQNGYIVPPRNPVLLAEGMHAVLTNGTLYNKLVIGGLQTAKRFSKDRFEREIVTALEAIFEARMR